LTCPQLFLLPRSLPVGSFHVTTASPCRVPALPRSNFFAQDFLLLTGLVHQHSLGLRIFFCYSFSALFFAFARDGCTPLRSFAFYRGSSFVQRRVLLAALGPPNGSDRHRYRPSPSRNTFSVEVAKFPLSNSAPPGSVSPPTPFFSRFFDCPDRSRVAAVPEALSACLLSRCRRMFPIADFFRFFFPFWGGCLLAPSPPSASPETKFALRL